MKKIVSFLIMAIFIANAPIAYAAETILTRSQIPIVGYEAEALQKLKMLNGTGSGLELEREITITEAITLIYYVTGISFNDIGYPEPSFSDISGHWGEDIIEKFYHANLVNGMSTTSFEPNRNVTGTEFITIIMSAMGYENLDSESVYQRAIEIGLLIDNFTKSVVYNNEYLLRSDAIRISYNALIAKTDKGIPLYKTSVENGLYTEETIINIIMSE